MNCNSNVHSLITETKGTCNGSCELKDINVICKNLIVPYGQEVLGIQGENNAQSRCFILEKETENGDDLSEKNFNIVIKRNDGKIFNIEITTKEILENYIKLKLDITEAITELAGDLSLQIIATSDDGYIWKTYPKTFVIVSSIEGGINK